MLMLITRITAPAKLFACLISLSATCLFAHEGAYHKIEKLTQQISKTPADPQLYLLRAVEYKSVAEWEKALSDYQRIAAINPEFEGLYYYRGLTLYQAGRYKNALQDLNKHLTQHPKNSTGMIARARVLNQLKQPQSAHKDYSQAIALLAKPPATLYIERSLALAEGGQAFLNEAILGLDEAIKHFGSMVVLETTAIELEVQRKNYKAALNRLDNILEQVTRKEKWLAKRGDILEKSGQKKQARIDYNEALIAIEQLPERTLRTPAMQALRSDLKQRLNPPTKSSAPQKKPLEKKKY